MPETLDLRSFVRDIESGLPAWIRRVIKDATPRLQGNGLGLGQVERRDILAAQASLNEPEARGLQLAWTRELSVHLQGLTTAPVAAATATALSAEVPMETQCLLTLKDEQEVDEDIELSRLIQDLESRCDSTLRDLRALCSALRGDRGVQADAPPLHPQALAATLGRAARSLPLTPSARLVLLRAAIPAASAVLQEVLRAQLQALKSAGVQPADFRVQTSVTPSRSAPAPALADENGSAFEASSQIRAVLHQLLARAGHSAEGATGPAGAVSDAWMQGVVQAALQEAAPAPRMRQVMERLAEPGVQLARAEPELWRQPEHAWWQLLDRLMALCSVLEAQPGGAQDQAAQRCEAAIFRLCTDLPPSSELCQQVLAEVDTVGRALAQEQVDDEPDVAPDAPPDAPPVITLARMVREQMSQQLRSSAAPSSMRRFLMGPWLRVLTSALDPHEGEPARAQRYTLWVDELLNAVRSSPDEAALHKLLDGVRDGLAYIQLPEAQIETWLFDITMRLHEVQEDEAADTARAQWKHEDLPTVPIDLHGSVHGARAKRDRVAWINNLRVGDICRVFLDPEWCTVHLIVDPVGAAKGDDAYVFQSRSPKRQHSLTRRALERLRSEGLATSVEQGSFIARALDTVAARLEDRLPGCTP